jgi:hypothetical protein
MTAWVEGVKGYGTGEWFEVSGAMVNTIYNCYQASPASWLNNSRVKRFKVYVDGEPHAYLDLTDEMGEQSFDLNLRHRNWDSTYIFRFEIVEVYKGAKWDDVCISHVDDMGYCFALTTQLSALAGSMLEAGSLERGAFILTYDPATDTVYTSEVLLNATQRHVTLLRVTAGGKTIEVTPDHPLDVQGRGFVSLQQLKSESPRNNYTTLIGTTSVLLWDEQSQSSCYAPIDSIEELHGNFQTATVRKLSKGSMYIANGFISKTY